MAFFAVVERQARMAMMPNGIMAQTHPMDTMNNASDAASTLFLGQNGEFWDFWLIVSVILAALIAGAVGVTTAGSIISHKREAQAADRELERFRVKTAGDIEAANVRVSEAQAQAAAANKKAAQASERAAEAELKLEKLRAPRVLNQAGAQIALPTLTPFSGTIIDVMVLGEGMEPRSLGTQIGQYLFGSASWHGSVFSWTGGGAATGVLVSPKPGSDARVMRASSALVEALNRSGIDATIFDWPGDWDRFAGFTDGAPNKDALIRVIIGAKPQ